MYFEKTWEVRGYNLEGTWRHLVTYLDATWEVLGDNWGGT